MTLDTLLSAVPFLPPERGEFYLPAINDTLQKYNLDTPLRTVHFLSQTGHESSSFSLMKENLNYSSQGLVSTFRKYFPTAASTKDYARNPVKIASKVYANRLGNGTEASGDGWSYRGRGAIQITGRDNYEMYSQHAGIDCIAHPEFLEQAPHCIQSSGWYFSIRGLIPLCDADNIINITKRINGGTLGLNDRTNRLMIAKKALGL